MAVRRRLRTTTDDYLDSPAEYARRAIQNSPKGSVTARDYASAARESYLSGQYYQGGPSAVKTISKAAWKDSLSRSYYAGRAAQAKASGATVGPSVDAGKPYPRVRPTPKSPKLPSGSVQPYNVRTAPKGSLRGMIPTGVTSNVPAIRRGYGVSGRLQGLGSALDAMSRYMKNLKR